MQPKRCARSLAAEDADARHSRGLGQTFHNSAEEQVRIFQAR
jgi:hypothetical protein